MFKNLLARPLKFKYGHLPPVEPGTPPATLQARPGGLPTTIKVLAYSPEGFEEEALEDLTALDDWLSRWPVVWLQVVGLGSIEKLEQLGHRFDLHPLVLEDIINGGQRPILEEYDQGLFILLNTLTLDPELCTEQVGIFACGNAVITFQPKQDTLLDPLRDRILKGRGRSRQMKVDYLTYSVLDIIVDHYFPMAEHYGLLLENLEDQIAATPGDVRTIAQIHTIKRELLTVRRSLWPLREIVAGLVGSTLEMISDEVRPYLQDCHQHVMQIIEIVTNYNEAAAALTDLYLSTISNSMNAVMKTLTIIATIFIPLTFIAGVFGMNFNTERSPLNMPELNWYWGYPAALLLMAVIGFFMYFYFKRKKWF
jgi:magnesium transporter